MGKVEIMSPAARLFYLHRKIERDLENALSDVGEDRYRSAENRLHRVISLIRERELILVEDEPLSEEEMVSDP